MKEYEVEFLTLNPSSEVEEYMYTTTIIKAVNESKAIIKFNKIYNAEITGLREIRKNEKR